MTLAHSAFSPDLLEFFRLAGQYQVEYVIVGGEAVIFHGYARFTGDVDIFYRPTQANTQALFAALTQFWSGNIPGISCPEELLEPGVIFQFGRPPHRLDLMGCIDGVNFEEAWTSKVPVQLSSGTTIYFIGLAELLKNKKASARPKDLADVAALS